MKLEHILKDERLAREIQIREERHAREKDIRVLREAMHPFYRSSDEITKRYMELEDKVEGLMDQQLHVQDRVIAIDDATMALESRVNEIDDNETRPKRRRRSRQAFTIPERTLSRQNTTNSTDPAVDEPADSRIESIVQMDEVKDRTKSPVPGGELSTANPPDSVPDMEKARKKLPPPADFAGPFDFVRAHAPISDDIYDTPSPVDLLDSLISKPMKQQIAELDKSTIHATSDPSSKKRKREMGPPEKLLSMTELSGSRD